MEYFIWFVIFFMVVSVVLLGIKARAAISKMQSEVNKCKLDDEKIDILYSFDAYKVIQEYKRLYPMGRILRYYRITMLAFFLTIICAVALFLLSIWYVYPINTVLDRPFLHGEGIR